MSNGHTTRQQRTNEHAYCKQCATHVIPNRGKCGWCDTTIPIALATRRERLTMQRAYEVTLLVHGGKA